MFYRIGAVVAILLALSLAPIAWAQPYFGPVFNYKGRILDKGKAPKVPLDLHLRFFHPNHTDPNGNVFIENVETDKDGYFSVDFEFFDIHFFGNSLIITMDVGIREAGTDGPYEYLEPRQTIPWAYQANYAIHAGTADYATRSGDHPWTRDDGLLIHGDANSNVTIDLRHQEGASHSPMLWLRSRGHLRPTLRLEGGGGHSTFSTYSDRDTSRSVLNLNVQNASTFQFHADGRFVADHVVAERFTSESFTASRFDYPRPKLHSLVINRHEFHSDGSAPRRVTLSGTSYNAPGPGTLYANVELPHGARVTSIQIDRVDSLPGVIHVYLFRQSFGSNGRPLLARDSTDGTGVTTISGLNFRVVDGIDYYLQVEATPGWPGPDVTNGVMAIKGVLIEYTVEGPN